MRKLTRTLGVLFSVITIAIAVSFLIDNNKLDQTRMSWMMIAMCGSLAFNGWSSYLNKKDRQGLLSVAVGIIILFFVLIKYPF